MGYMDNVGGGVQDSFGGYQQMHRKPRYAQIGNTRMQAPLSLGLDKMYGGQQTMQSAPGMESPTKYSIPMPENYVSEGGFGGTNKTAAYNQYLQERGWTKDESGRWMPEGTEQYQTYEDAGGNRYIYTNGEWKQMTRTEEGKYTLGEDYALQQARAEQTRYVEKIDEARAALTEHEKLMPTPPNPRYAGNAAVQAYEAELAEWQAKKDELEHQIETYQSMIDWRKNQIMQEVEREGATVDTQRWQDQLQGLMDQIEMGEISYTDEEGNIDVSSLRESGNVMSDWLADVLEESANTGVIQGALTDEEGNLAPELETMVSYYESNPELQENFDRFNKQMAMNAIASGQSLNSAYYSEHTANIVADYSAQVGEHIVQTMMGELESQYNYVQNSFAAAMKQAGIDVDTDVFAANMERAYDAIREEYRQGIEQLAMAVAEREADRRGAIFSGILSFVIDSALSLIPGA